MSNDENQNKSPWDNDDDPWHRKNDSYEIDQLKKIWSHLKGKNKGENRHIGGKFPGGNPLRTMVAASIFLLCLWFATGIYQVRPDERGVVLRFGRFVHSTGPGLHYHLPFPIEEVLLQNITTVNRIDIGTRRGNYKHGGIENNPTEEGVMLTGDSNLANVTFSVLWRIKDNKVEDYLFNTRSPDITVAAVAESIMREIIGQTPIAFAQTEGRSEINARAHKHLQAIMDKYGVGVEIVQIQLQNVEPPASVIDSFRDVERAQADQQREINQADAYSRDIAARTRGKVGEIINEAQGRKNVLIVRATGLAKQFDYIFEQYRRNPEVTAKRIYIETLEEVLARAPKLLISKNASNSGIVPYLPIQELVRDKKN